MRDEAEDLEDLLRHPGWALLMRYVEQEWSTKFEQHVLSAVNDRDDAMALSKLRQITVAKQAVQTLMQWPSERLRHVQATTTARAQEQTTPLSRRGTL